MISGGQASFFAKRPARTLELQVQWIQTGRNATAQLLTAISGSIVGDGPGTIATAGDDGGKKATISVFADHFHLLLIAGRIADGGRTSG
jgi:hypothetical protein